MTHARLSQCPERGCPVRYRTGADRSCPMHPPTPEAPPWVAPLREPKQLEQPERVDPGTTGAQA